MRINSILRESKVNGPGKRGVVWVQGCSQHCKGCFNQAACTQDEGIELSPLQIISQFDYEQIEGLTVSGGEPFDQSRELKELLTLAKERGLNTLVYSGYLYEKLLAEHKDVLELCDYLIDGPFMQDIPSECKWAGSGNQRFLQLQAGFIVNNLTDREDYSQNAEIIIEESGNITITGFIEA